MGEYKTVDFTHLEWVEYDFGGSNNTQRVYRVNSPISMTFRIGGWTHQIVDGDGIVHVLPGPGYRGCVIRQKGKEV